MFLRQLSVNQLTISHVARVDSTYSETIAAPSPVINLTIDRVTTVQYYFQLFGVNAVGHVGLWQNR